MKLRRTRRFERDYANAPREVQTAFDKQSQFLLRNLHHPSLRVKKYDESQNLWQARVTRDWRFYFLIEGDTFYLIRLMAHPK
jgi:mRNA interferase RelE/StbE